MTRVAQSRFTGDEDRALLEIMEAMTLVRWEAIAKALHERGFPLRTAKSIRNHHLRQRKASLETPNLAGHIGKNRCRKCGMWRKGHVCAATTASASPSLPPET